MSQLPTDPAMLDYAALERMLAQQQQQQSGMGGVNPMQLMDLYSTISGNQGMLGMGGTGGGGGEGLGSLFGNIFGGGGGEAAVGGGAEGLAGGLGASWIAAPLAAAAAMTGVNMFGEGKTPAQTFGSEGWGGGPMAMFEDLFKGDVPGAMQSFGAGGGDPITGFAGGLMAGEDLGEAAQSFLGPIPNILDWLKGGDTSDLIRIFSFPTGPATRG